MYKDSDVSDGVTCDNQWLLTMVYQISLLIIITAIITDNDVDEESGVGRPDNPVYNMIKMMTMMMLMMTAKNMITTIMMMMMMMMKRKEE